MSFRSFRDYPCNKCKPTTVAEPFLECKRSQNEKAREIHGSRETRRTCEAIFEFLRFPRVECLLSVANAFFSPRYYTEFLSFLFLKEFLVVTPNLRIQFCISFFALFPVTILMFKSRTYYLISAVASYLNHFFRDDANAHP